LLSAYSKSIGSSDAAYVFRMYSFIVVESHRLKYSLKPLNIYKNNARFLQKPLSNWNISDFRATIIFTIINRL